MINLNGLFKDLIFDNVVKIAIQRLLLKVPLLAWGPIGYFVTIGLTRFAEVLFEVMDEMLDLKGIALNKYNLRDKYLESALTLNQIAIEKGINSEEFKKARQNDMDKFSRFIRFNHVK